MIRAVPPLLSLALLSTVLAGCDRSPPPPPDARPLAPPGPTGDPRIAMTQAMDLAMKQSEIRDLWPDRPYRVDLRDDDGAGRATLGLLDLDRDGAWDMRWSREGGVLLFARSPDDDGQYGEFTPWEGPRMPGDLEIQGR